MPRQKTADRKPAIEEPAEDYVPSWQRDSVDRSLRNAIDRARKRSDRFVDAAVELLSERDEGDFSIQDVVDRSSQSQRTFYTFFDSKDSLMLAVYETILRKTAMPMLQQRCEGVEDPVLRLRALLDALSEITEMPARLARGLSVLHLRLAETRPNDLAGAVEPLHAFIVELLTGVAKAGRPRGPRAAHAGGAASGIAACLDAFPGVDGGQPDQRRRSLGVLFRRDIASRGLTPRTT